MVKVEEEVIPQTKRNITPMAIVGGTRKSSSFTF